MSPENTANQPHPIDDSDDVASPSTDAPSAMSDAANSLGLANTAKWFLGCVAVSVLLGFAAAHAPGRVRLIGLFPIAVGVLLGVVISHLSLHFRQKLATAIYVGAVLSGITMTLMYAESFRMYAADVRNAFSEDPSFMLRASARNQSTSAKDDPQAAEAAEQLQALIDEGDTARKEALDEITSVPNYLQFRVRGLGELDEPIPLCIALLEAIAGLIGCCLMIRICIVKHIIIAPSNS